MEDVIKQWQDSLKERGLEVKDRYYAPPEIKIKYHYNLLQMNLKKASAIYSSLPKLSTDENIKAQYSIFAKIEDCSDNCYDIACEITKYKDLIPQDDYPCKNPYKTVADNGLYDVEKARLLDGLHLFMDIGLPRIELKEHPNLAKDMVETKLPELAKFAKAMLKVIDESRTIV